MNSYAMELARRGFVVFAVSANGSGISEFPQRDEIGAGEQDYDAATRRAACMTRWNLCAR